jgi:hypothetical protein
MKGQYLTVEYVFFFAFGVILAISVFFLFSSMSDNLREDALTYQLEKAGEFVRGNIVKSFITANTTESTVFSNVSIPTELSKCLYVLDISDDNMIINCTDNYKIGTVLSLYGINVTDAGLIYSSRGLIEITAWPNGVELR